MFQVQIRDLKIYTYVEIKVKPGRKLITTVFSAYIDH